MVRVHFGPPLLINLRNQIKAQRSGFDLERRNKDVVDLISRIWGVSSAGRAPALQAGGHRFDPGTLHHKKLTEGAEESASSLSFLKEKFRCTLKTEHC